MEKNNKKLLERVILRVRHALLIRGIIYYLIWYGQCILPLAALLVVIGNRTGGTWGIWAGLGCILSLLGLSFLRSFFSLGDYVRTAFAADRQAHLKDRITSAYEFITQGNLDDARTVQIDDAIQYACSLDPRHIIPLRYPRWSFFFPVVLLLFCMSFLVPPSLVIQDADANTDRVRQAQLEELSQLEEDLVFDEDHKELSDVLEKLRDIKKQFEKGEMSERSVMIQLARLDMDLRQKVAEMGVDNLEGELNEIVPRLMSAAAATEVANAIKEDQLDKAAKELEKLGDKVKANQLSDKEKRQLAMNMGLVASKLGGKQDGSFGGDFASATKALENSDSKGFCQSCQSMGNKLNLLDKARQISKASKKIGACKSCLGQCNSCNGKEAGYATIPKSQGKKKGGLKAGTAASGDPLGEANRLEESLRKMVRVNGQAGMGPVDTEVEITEGQLSQSQTDLKEIYRNFAAVAEEAIENEAIPLSHRYHVKRYFQSIRPQE